MANISVSDTCLAEIKRLRGSKDSASLVSARNDYTNKYWGNEQFWVDWVNDIDFQVDSNVKLSLEDSFMVVNKAILECPSQLVWLKSLEHLLHNLDEQEEIDQWEQQFGDILERGLCSVGLDRNGGEEIWGLYRSFEMNRLLDYLEIAQLETSDIPASDHKKNLKKLKMNIIYAFSRQLAIPLENNESVLKEFDTTLSELCSASESDLIDPLTLGRSYERALEMRDGDRLLLEESVSGNEVDLSSWLQYIQYEIHNEQLDRASRLFERAVLSFSSLAPSKNLESISNDFLLFIHSYFPDRLVATAKMLCKLCYWCSDIWIWLFRAFEKAALELNYLQDLIEISTAIKKSVHAGLESYSSFLSVIIGGLASMIRVAKRGRFADELVKQTTDAIDWAIGLMHEHYSNWKEGIDMVIAERQQFQDLILFHTLNGNWTEKTHQTIVNVNLSAVSKWLRQSSAVSCESSKGRVASMLSVFSGLGLLIDHEVLNSVEGTSGDVAAYCHSHLLSSYGSIDAILSHQFASHWLACLSSSSSESYAVPSCLRRKRRDDDDDTEAIRKRTRVGNHVDYGAVVEKQHDQQLRQEEEEEEEKANEIEIFVKNISFKASESDLFTSIQAKLSLSACPWKLSSVRLLMDKAGKSRGLGYAFVSCSDPSQSPNNVVEILTKDDGVSIKGRRVAIQSSNRSQLMKEWRDNAEDGRIRQPRHVSSKEVVAVASSDVSTAMVVVEESPAKDPIMDNTVVDTQITREATVSSTPVDAVSSSNAPLHPTSLFIVASLPTSIGETSIRNFFSGLISAEESIVATRRLKRSAVPSFIIQFETPKTIVDLLARFGNGIALIEGESVKVSQSRYPGQLPGHEAKDKSAPVAEGQFKPRSVKTERRVKMDMTEGKSNQDSSASSKSNKEFSALYK